MDDTPELSGPQLTIRILTILVACIGLFGCTDDQTEDGAGIEVYVDASATSGVDMSDEDSGSSDDSGIDSGSADAGRPDAAPRWMVTDIACDEAESPISYPPGPGFEPLPEPFRVNQPLSKDSIELANAGVAHKLYAFRGTRGVGVRGWVINEPQDIGFTIALFTQKPLAPTTTVDVTSLIDYEPASIDWRLVAPNDEDIEKEATSPGFRFPFDEAVEVIDAKIPYELFAEPGYHEVVIYMNASGPEQYIIDRAFRLSIWNQSFQRPSHPCVPEGAASPMTDEELAVREFLSGPRLIPFDADEDGSQHLREGIVVRPGEDVSANYYINGGALFRNQQYQAAFFPTLNGVPIGETEFLITPYAEYLGGDGPREVVMRRELTFQAPDEPGEYDFGVGFVTNVWIPTINTEGWYTNLGERGGNLVWGSKMRIHVSE